MRNCITQLRQVSIALGGLLTFGILPVAHAVCTVTGGSGSPNNISSNLAPGVTLTVTGTCLEDVVIRDDDVTIKSGATRAKIGSATPLASHDAILIDGARRVVLRSITVNRGRYGIKSQRGASFELIASTVTGARDTNIYVFGGSTALIKNATVQNADSKGSSDAHGIIVSGNSHAVIEGGRVRNNKGWGIIAAKGSHAEIIGTTITGNDADAAFAARNASMTIEGSTINNNGYGVGSYHGSSLQVTGASINNNAGAGMDIFASSHGDVRDTTITADVDVSPGDGIYVSHSSNLRLQDTVVTVDSGTIGAQTCCHNAIWVAENSNLDMREGNTISSNIEDLDIGATIAIYRGSTARIRGGTDATETDAQFNRIINTAPVVDSCVWNTSGGYAIDTEHVSSTRIDSGHTKIEGSVYIWNLSSVDLRDVNIKGIALADDPGLSRMRFRDQGTVAGNVTLESGKLCHFGGGVDIRGPSSSQQPTFNANIDCNGSGYMPGPPIFGGGFGFINCP